MLFSFFQNFSFLHFKDGGKCKIWSKMAIQICLTLYLRNCTSYDCGFWYTCVKWWYLQQFFFFFSFFQNSDFLGFSKFINKCQKEILGCAPPSSHVCDSFSVSLSSPKNFICNIMSLSNWQYRYIHTYQIWFQMFHFPIAGYQFTSMSSKLVDRRRSSEVESQDSNLWNSCQNLL